jgi:cell division protein FtsL
MGIYFLIAVALSAMSVVTEVQVSRPAFATVASVRAERRATRTYASNRVRSAHARVGRASARPDGLKPVLQSSAAPRAPAFGC